MPGARLVGREAELDLLTQWIREVAGGLGRPVLIEGEPGIGKSALLQAARSRAIAAGCAVFWGAAEELGKSFPLLPFLTALSTKPAQTDPAAAAESLVALIDQLCAQSPVVLVVDDLHWADTTTVSLCHRLARSAAQRPLLLIGAMRPLPRRDDLKALRRAVDRAGRPNLLRLKPLPPKAAAEMVADLAGGDPGPDLARLAADAAGNPLYLTELVDALRRCGGLAVRAGTADLTGAATDAPATLHEAISDRLDFLPGPAREALRAAALLGGEFSVDDLAVVTGRRPAELAPALADAQAVGVLADAGDQMAFRHPLIRAALYDELPASVRAAWHRDAAFALLRAGAPAPAVARQLLPAVTDLADQEIPLGDWVTDWLVEAAPELAGQASAVAAALLREAVGRLAAHDRRRHLLTVHLSRALAYQAAHEEVEALVTSTLPHVTDASLLVDLYDALVTSRDATRLGFEETLAELDRVTTENPRLPEGARLRLNVLAARVELKSGDLRQLEGRARQTLATATALGDRWAIGWMCSVLAACLWAQGDVQTPLELLDQGLAATADDPGLLDPYLVMLCNRGISEAELDLFEQSHTTLTEARLLAERTGKLGRAVQLQRSLCQLNFNTGRWDDALAEADLPESVDASNRFQAHHVTAVIAFHRGDPAARKSLAAAKRLAPRVSDVGQWMLTDALAHEVAGDPQAALQVLSAGLAEFAGLIDTELWLADAVRLATDAGDAETASTATAEAEALAASSRHVPRRAAIVTHCQGILRADPRLVLQAADGYAEIARPLPQAQALEAAARQLAERGDTAAARVPFVAALDLYAGLGAEWDISRMRARFRTYGMHRPTRRLRRPTSGWGALTAAEAKVAELVALGRSNPEIAEGLVVSRRTVESHVTHILAKLQVRSRVDLARVAAIRSQPAGRVK